MIGLSDYYQINVVAPLLTKYPKAAEPLNICDLIIPQICKVRRTGIL